MIATMTEPASKMGGDALVDVRSSTFAGKQPTSMKRWASGIVGKFLEEKPVTSPQGDFVVTILPKGMKPVKRGGR